MSADVVALTQRLLALDTTGGGEHAAALVAADVLDRAGWRVRLLPFAPGRSQLLAVLGEPAPSALCLCGHLDTVPAGDGWSADPLGGVVSDGFLHGRGSADMKGGVAAMLSAAVALAGARRPPTGTVIALTAAEETGAHGAHALRDAPELELVSGMIVGEPTSNQVQVGHRGAVWLDVRTTGTAAHAAAPEAGVNALSALRSALDRLDGAGLDRVEPDALLGAATMAVTSLHAGGAVNVVPDRAHATLDIRTVPALPPDAVLARAREAAGPDAEVSERAAVPALAGALDGALARALRAAGAGRAPNPAARFFTDGGVLQRPGREIVLCGPGEAEQAHRVDERCSVEQLAEAAALYERVALGWTA